jgi:hypothetical protein
MMVRMVRIGWCALACATLGAGAADSAAAAAPEFGRCMPVAAGTGGYGNSGCTLAGGTKNFEWVPGPGAKPLFTATSKAGTSATLQTVKGHSITCSGATTSGRFNTPATVVYTALTFTGCKTPAGVPCEVPNNPQGEIRITGLQGRLGIIKKAAQPVKNKIGLRVYYFDSGLACGAESVGLKGSVIVPVKTNTMLITETQKYSQTKGKQKPLAFEGEAPTLLEMSFSAPYEQAGLGMTVIQTNEEKMEVNSVV